jgi:hypothetical protein
MHPERIAIRGFVRQLGYEAGSPAIHATCYYAEFVENRTDFGLVEIEDLLIAAKVPAPANLARDLRSLLEKKFLNMVKGTSGPTIRYTLTNPGADVITERMKEVKLVITKPTERADILKEVSESLYSLLKTIPDQKEQEFIEEAVSCLSPVNNALRAAVVLGWNGAIACLRRKIDQLGPAGYQDFHRYYSTLNPKAKLFNNLNDFEDVKDKDLLDVCDRMNIIKGKSVKMQLQPWLEFRNGVGHPTNVKPGIHKVKAFFEDIVTYVLAVP